MSQEEARKKIDRFKQEKKELEENIEEELGREMDKMFTVSKKHSDMCIKTSKVKCDECDDQYDLYKNHKEENLKYIVRKVLARFSFDVLEIVRINRYTKDRDYQSVVVEFKMN